MLNFRISDRLEFVIIVCQEHTYYKHFTSLLWTDLTDHLSTTAFVHFHLFIHSFIRTCLCLASPDFLQIYSPLLCKQLHMNMSFFFARIYLMRNNKTKQGWRQGHGKDGKRKYWTPRIPWKSITKKYLILISILI